MGTHQGIMVLHFNYTSETQWERPSCDQSINSKRALMSARQTLLDNSSEAVRTARGYGSPTAGTITGITEGACQPYWAADWGESSSQPKWVLGKYNTVSKPVL